MESKITQFVKQLLAEKQAETPHCDISSSQIHLINTPISTELFHELESISSEYHRDINCLAGDLLALALKEAIEHIPRKEKAHLDKVRHAHEVEEAEQLKEQSVYDAGGT